MLPEPCTALIPTPLDADVLPATPVRPDASFTHGRIAFFSRLLATQDRFYSFAFNFELTTVKLQFFLAKDPA
ncbi:hypothetical protein C9E91_14965 [Rhizobium sp. SEMIA4064]|nr:hypothetical protein C9E91_14965 [Rhizobium sp. SEMIA4064]